PSASEFFSSRKTLLSSPAEIMSAFTLQLAITLTSPARACGEAELTNPAATRSILRHFITFSFAYPGLEINAGLNDQSVSVGLEALGVHLGVEPVWVCAFSITIHEVTFHFHVPEFFQVKPRGDDFVVDVIGGQAGVSLVRGQRSERAAKNTGYRVAGVIGAKLNPFDNSV